MTLTTPLHHQVTGQGPHTLLWAHGMGFSMAADDGLGLFDWETLAHHCTLVRYDARGHGRSRPLAEPDEACWPALASDMLALAAVLGRPHFIAAGQSMGCATALHAACRHPDRVQGLVLVNPPTAWDSRPAQTQQYARLALALERKGRTSALVPWLRSRRPLPAWQAQARPDRIATHDRALLELPASTLATILQGARHSDLPTPAQLARLPPVPALILAWTDDPGHPLGTAETLARLLPRSELQVASSMAELAGWTDRIIHFLAQNSAT